MSQITLSDAVSQLWMNISSTSSADPIVIPSINSLLQRFYNAWDFDGKFSADTLMPVYTDANGYQTIALPGIWFTAEYIRDLCAGDLPVWNEFKKYQQPDGCAGWHSEDLGDGFSTWFDLPSAGKLFVQTNAVPATSSIIVNGTDANGHPLTETMALGTAGVTSTNTFLTIVSIVKTAIVCDTLLYWVKPSDSSHVQIGQYAPNEVYPKVRRYLIVRGTNSTALIYAKLRRRFIPAVLGTDIIIPGNIPALEQGLLAIAAQKAGDQTRYAELWTLAKAELDGELQQFIGEAQTGSFVMNADSPMMNLQNIP